MKSLKSVKPFVKWPSLFLESIIICDNWSFIDKVAAQEDDYSMFFCFQQFADWPQPHKTVGIWEALTDPGIFHLPLCWNGGNLDTVP